MTAVAGYDDYRSGKIFNIDKEIFFRINMSENVFVICLGSADDYFGLFVNAEMSTEF